MTRQISFAGDSLEGRTMILPGEDTAEDRHSQEQKNSHTTAVAGNWQVVYPSNNAEDRIHQRGIMPDETVAFTLGDQPNAYYYYDYTVDAEATGEDTERRKLAGDRIVAILSAFIPHTNTPPLNELGLGSLTDPKLMTHVRPSLFIKDCTVPQQPEQQMITNMQYLGAAKQHPTLGQKALGEVSTHVPDNTVIVGTLDFFRGNMSSSAIPFSVIRNTLVVPLIHDERKSALQMGLPASADEWRYEKSTAIAKGRLPVVGWLSFVKGAVLISGRDVYMPEGDDYVPFRADNPQAAPCLLLDTKDPQHENFTGGAGIAKEMRERIKLAGKFDDLEIKSPLNSREAPSTLPSRGTTFRRPPTIPELAYNPPLPEPQQEPQPSEQPALQSASRRRRRRG